MFTKLRMAKWSYMILAVTASLAIATLATLLTLHSAAYTQSKASQDSEQTSPSRYPQLIKSSMRFIN